MKKATSLIFLICLAQTLNACADASALPTLTQIVIESMVTPAPPATPPSTATQVPTQTPIPTATYEPAAATAVANGECLHSFQAFAYYGPAAGGVTQERDNLYPLPPWQMMIRIPSQPEEEPREGNLNYLNLVRLARTMDGEREIWVEVWGANPSPDMSNNNLYDSWFWAIYKPDSHQWEFVPHRIENTTFETRDLYVTRDGTVWASIIWDESEDPSFDSVPVLSRFNEATRRFELAENGLALSPGNWADYVYPWPKIALDKQDTFWIFAHNDGIYSYDSLTGNSEKHADLLDVEVSSTALSPDGTIYFQKYQYEGQTLFRLPDNVLFHFTPETEAIELLDVPEEEWPVFDGLLVDHTGRLWLGSVGYQDPDGTWTLLHTNTELYFSHLGQALFAPASIMLESSDGRVWFAKYFDTNGYAEGVAWYDPQTREGCVITNGFSYIVEDTDRQLWIAIDSVLYTLDLNE